MESWRDKMAERKPVFEMHIRPLFRLLDRQHIILNSGLDLWDYDAVKRKSDQILIKVKGTGDTTMPLKIRVERGRRNGSDLFDRWIQGGFRRLSLGTARASD
jgi:hypothetical protein